MGQLAIEAHHIGRLYGSGSDVVGLRDLSLEVPAGRVLALLGPNGAGKTTAVRGLATLLRFDHGRARVAGYDVASQPQPCARPRGDSRAELNPLSATAGTVRDLLGTASWPTHVVPGSLHTVLAVAWPAVLTGVFAPLAARRFRAGSA